MNKIFMSFFYSYFFSLIHIIYYLGGVNLEEKIIQTLTLENRERLGITGVERVESFNNENVILATNRGKLTIKGNNISISKLNVEEGRLSVNGRIDSLLYSENSTEKEKVGLVKKIFR